MQICFAVITISDRSSRGERPDTSGPALAQAVTSHGWLVSQSRIVPDDFDQIRNSMISLCEDNNIQIILTTGGTGFSPRDITPEATLSILDKQAPGLAENMRASSLKTTPHAMLSRAVAGIHGNTLIINLPGSPKGAVENFEFISSVLPHAVELLTSSPDSERHHSFS
jgi:molybdopterin adenylyltransferase